MSLHIVAVIFFGIYASFPRFVSRRYKLPEESDIRVRLAGIFFVLYGVVSLWLKYQIGHEALRPEAILTLSGFARVLVELRPLVLGAGAAAVAGISIESYQHRRAAKKR